MVRSSSRKKQDDLTNDWSDYPFLTAKGVELIKYYTTPRILLGSGLYGSYRDSFEKVWKIGYGSLKINRHWVKNTETATKKEIDTQLVEDLKEFSTKVASYVFVPLNANRKGALLSFAHSVGISSFKDCRLLALINSLASKNEIIKEWSPYINLIWQSGGETMINRRRTELNLYFAGDKEIPTQIKHTCYTNRCLLNLPETYNGAPTQIKAIEYLERKINEWDQSGEALRRFFRLWDEKPSGLGSEPRKKAWFEDN